MNTLHKLGIALLLVPTLFACGSARRSEPITAPLVLDDIEFAGRRVFQHSCYTCHIQGEGGLGPSLNEKALPAFAIRFQVRHGWGAMPAFTADEISDEDLDALVAYVQALRHR